LGKHGAIYGIGSFAERGTLFVLIPVYLSLFTVDQYGQMGLVLACYELGVVTMDFGLRAGVFRSLFDGHSSDAKSQVLSTALLLQAVLGVLLGLVVLPTTPWIADFLLHDQELYLLIAMALGASLLKIQVDMVMCTLRAEKRSVLLSVLQILSFVLRVGFTVALLNSFTAAVFWAVVALVIADAAMLVLGLLIIKDYLRPVFDSQEAWRMLVYGLPVMASLIAGVVDMHIGRVFLTSWVGLGAVGVYTLANQISRILSAFVIGPFKSIWTPVMLSAKDDDNFGSLCSYAMTYVMAGSGVAALAVALWLREGISLLGQEEYDGVVPVAQILIVATWIDGASLILRSPVYVLRTTHVIAIFSIAKLILGILAAALLIPFFGLYGAALATLITRASSIAGYFAYNRHVARIRFQVRKLAVIAMLLLGGLWAGNLTNDVDLVIATPTKLAILASYPLLLAAFGVVDRRERAMIREEAGKVLRRVYSSDSRKA
jgi:O-antigen/teichoic acid export membrane protein